MSGLDDVKKWMSFIGWDNGGGDGSCKRDADGKIIAQHGDATWIEDVQDCCDRSEAAAARVELERRNALGFGHQQPASSSLVKDSKP